MARIVNVRKEAGSGGMTVGLITVEVYLPFDPVKFAAFEALVAANAGDVEAAEAADPELARLALEPVDSHKEAMLAPDLQQLAHAFNATSQKIDMLHDFVQRPSVLVVESFINDDEIASAAFFPGAWVMRLKIEAGSDEWDLVEAGVLRAVSFAAEVDKVPVSMIPAGSA